MWSEGTCAGFRTAVYSPHPFRFTRVSILPDLHRECRVPNQASLSRGIADTLERGVAQTALELDFPAEVAARQLETIVNWGRYTELLAYDDTRDVFYLEPSGIAPTSAGIGTAAGS